MLKKKLIVSLFIFLLIALIAFFLLTDNLSRPRNAQTPPGQTYEVVLTDNGFTPQYLNIKPGDFVKFKSELHDPFWPASDLHPTHGIYPEFDPQEPVDPQNSWTFQFLKTGKWKYHDHLRPAFRGIIYVQ